MKKARRKAKASWQRDFIILLDQAMECCVNIEMVAELVKGIEITEVMHPSANGRAGYFVSSETQKLRDVLRELHRQLPRSKRPD